MACEFSIIFCTCDSYSDLWDGFFYLFKKYWPDFDGEIIFNTDKIEYTYNGLNIVNVKHEEGANMSWSDMLNRALDLCKYEEILLILEDFYFLNRVKHKKVLDTVEVMKKNNNIVSITYLNEPGAYRKSDVLKGFDYRKHFSLYKMTAHMTLYKKAFLKKILRSNENAWQFEINGTVRSWLLPGDFLCMEKGGEPIIPYDGDFVRLGKFIKERKEYYEINENIVFSNKRGILENFYDHKENVTNHRKIKMFAYGIKAIPSIWGRKPR